MHFQAVCSLRVPGDIDCHIDLITPRVSCILHSGCPHFNQFIDTGESNQDSEGPGNYVSQV